MKIEIIAIGSEILAGMIVNTNATYLSKTLRDHSYLTRRHTVLPDDPDFIKNELHEILKRNDIVIVTGGLGPTCDDLTRGIFAEYFDKKMVFSEEVAKDLRSRFGNSLASLEDQSMVPENTQFFCNPLGTAPSLAFVEQGKVVVLLPGVPQEMKALFSQKVLPFLLKNFPPEKQVPKREYHLCFFVESEVDPFLRELEKDFPSLVIGIYPSYGYLSISLSSEDQTVLEEASSRLTSHYQTYLYSKSSSHIAEALQEEMIQKKKTLALAESFTGGAMAAALTAVPGSSKYFLGSIVSYANSLKEKHLLVSSYIIEKYGAVSEQAVTAMLEGLFQTTDADYGIAVSGIAGPDGGSKDKPVGTSWIAIGERGKKPHVGLKVFRGNREIVIFKGVTVSLSMLWRLLKHEKAPFSHKGYI